MVSDKNIDGLTITIFSKELIYKQTMLDSCTHRFVSCSYIKKQLCSNRTFDSTSTLDGWLAIIKLEPGLGFMFKQESLSCEAYVINHYFPTTSRSFYLWFRTHSSQAGLHPAPLADQQRSALHLDDHPADSKWYFGAHLAVENPPFKQLISQGFSWKIWSAMIFHCQVRSPKGSYCRL